MTKSKDDQTKTAVLFPQWKEHRASDEINAQVSKFFLSYAERHQVILTHLDQGHLDAVVAREQAEIEAHSLGLKFRSDDPDEHGAQEIETVQQPSPPRLAEWIMAAMMPAGEGREALLGDYAEQFEKHVRERGHTWAWTLAYADAFRSVAPLCWLGFKRIGWISVILSIKSRIIG